MPPKGSPVYRRQASRSGERRGGGGYSSDQERARDKDSTNYTQIYVAKLSRRTNEEDLRLGFSKFGRINSVSLKQGYAFIDFENHDSAVAAVKEMHCKLFVNGEELVVEQSGT